MSLPSNSSKPLNLLDILNARIAHEQKVVKPTDLAKLPRVYSGLVSDGVHDMTYGYANVNRVFHELISNSRKAIRELDRKSSLGNLNEYLVNEDRIDINDDATNKLVIGANGTISNAQFLKFNRYDRAVIDISDGLRDIIASYAADEFNIVIITKTKLYAFNSKENALHLLEDFTTASESDLNEFVLSTRDLSDKDAFQLVTNRRVLQYKILHRVKSNNEDESRDEPEIAIECSLNIDFAAYYANVKLTITDVTREVPIENIIANTLSEIPGFNPSASPTRLWYNDFIPIANSMLEASDPEKPAATTSVILQTIGFLVGEYGIFKLVQQSNRQVFIQLIDDEPVVKTLIYTKDKRQWLVVFNNIGVKTYEIKSDGIRIFNTTLEDLPPEITARWKPGDPILPSGEGFEFKWLPESGNIETYENSGNYVNVNDLLEFGFVPDPGDPTVLSKRIPGAAIADLQYAYVKTKFNTPVIVIRDIHNISKDENIANVNGIRCFFNNTVSGMHRLLHDYDLHEFNGLKEVSISDVARFNNSDTHFLFAINNVGIVKGEIKRDSKGVAGMKLANIQKYDKARSRNNNGATLMPAGQAVFVFNNNTGEFFTSSIASDTLLNLKIDNRLIPVHISNVINNVAYISDKQRTTVFKGRLVRHFEEKPVGVADEIMNIVLNNSSGRLQNNMQEHLHVWHNENSAMSRLNRFIYKLKQQSIEDSTVFIPNTNIAYISTGYSLSNIERKVTDKNSPYIYGRVNSKTLNSYIGAKTRSNRNNNSISYYDTVVDENNKETSLNVLTYIAYKLSDNIIKLEVNVPTTFTYYVNNIIGWSKGSHTGSSIERRNLNGGFINGKLENTLTEYQLVLNREYFKIARVLCANCQLASAPLRIYSDKKYTDATHFGMFDSPIITPLCTNQLLEDNTFEIVDNPNNEVALSFCIFGGDALSITVLLEVEN